MITCIMEIKKKNILHHIIFALQDTECLSFDWGHLRRDNSLLLFTFLTLLHSCNHFRITRTHTKRSAQTESGKDRERFMNDTKRTSKLYEVIVKPILQKFAHVVCWSHNSEEFSHWLQYLLVKYSKTSHLIYPCQYKTHRKGHIVKGSLQQYGF